MDNEKYLIEREELVKMLETAYENGWKGYLDAKECEAESITEKFVKSAKELSGPTEDESGPYWSNYSYPLDGSPIVADACTDVEITDPLLSIRGVKTPTIIPEIFKPTILHNYA